MHHKKDDKNYHIALQGVTYKTLVYGERTSLCEFKLEKGSIIPSHSHPHEQTGYMVSGKMNFIIGAETFTAEAGTSWNIPSNIEHSVKVIEDSLVIEVFSPVREDYLP